MNAMRSPFPGVDPYLEPHWLDVHTALIAGARDSLNQTLPDDLIASAEERIAVESEEGQEHRFGPHVKVFEAPDAPATSAPQPSTAVATTYRRLAQVEPITERYLKVLDAGTGTLITVIEFISPANKSGPGIWAFRSKRAELLAAGVNFVEIDLVRGGDWRTLLKPHSCPARGVSPCRYTVPLPADPGAVYLQPIWLADRLPDVPIPLRSTDEQVKLALQPLLDNAYMNGRYSRRLDYHTPLDPPLSPQEAAWADDLLRAAGKR